MESSFRSTHSHKSPSQQLHGELLDHLMQIYSSKAVNTFMIVVVCFCLWGFI